jgi:hypothetical protein
MNLRLGPMHLSRLRIGELVAAAAGLLLIVSLFLPWYEAGQASHSAWETFAVIDAFLDAVGVSAVVLLILTALHRVDAVPMAAAALLAVAALVAVVLVAVRLLVLPELPGPGDTSLEIGSFLGLLGALGVFAGAWLSMRDDRPRRVAPGYADPPPRVIPAPPPEGTGSSRPAQGT